MIIGSKLLECNLEVSLLQLVIASINRVLSYERPYWGH